MIEVYNEFLKARRTGIVSFVKDYVVDGNTPDKDGQKRIFLATNGSWQTKYLSFYEVLHDKYIARFLAQALLDEYLTKIQDEVISIISNHIDNKEQLLEKLYQTVRFDKIITVTVSSQLIGVALRDLIKDNKKYSMFLKRDQLNPLKNAPQLLILSSYYSYDEEKPFQKIIAEDKVVVVNDVISTGNLVYDLSTKIIYKRLAIVKAVFSIADTRIPEGRIKYPATETEYKFNEDFEKTRFFTLTNAHDEVIIRKFKRPHPKSQSLKIKRINPLLNSIVELKASYSEENKILFPDPADLISKEIFNESVFKIGHFNQNIAHTGFLTDMQSIFSCNSSLSTGEKLLNKVKIEIDNNRYISGSVDNIFNNLKYNLQQLYKWSNGDNYKQELIQVEQQIESLRKSTMITKEISGFKADFIFYPVFSGIEQLDHGILSNTFQCDIQNIVGLQRFDTNKGWRFPFPAKRFNQITKNKSVLILDSGSLTGESLVQLIDSIAFLDVKEINVLCIIARIEDFYREFYSKLTATKVKLLRKTGSNQKDRSGLPEHIVPLNIWFGINLHIPVYPSAIACPFCLELQDLDYYEELFDKFTPSTFTRSYIKERRVEIGVKNLGLLDEHFFPSYIPKNKNGNWIDSVELFLMRDRLGRVESYRFYPEYFEYFDDIIGEIDFKNLYIIGPTNKLELILAIILHEPKLLDTIKDLLIDVKESCQQIIEDIIFLNKAEIKSLYYNWTKYAILRLAFVFRKNTIFNIDDFELLFSFSVGDDDCLNYLSFILWKGFFNIEKNENVETGCTDILLEMARKFDDDEPAKEIYKDETIRDIIKDITEQFKNTPTQDINQAYFNLAKFFISMSSNETHDELSRFISKIAVNNLNPKTDDLLMRMYHDAYTILSLIKKHVFDNLSIIKAEKRLVKVHEINYSMLFNTKDSIYSDFEQLWNDYRLIKIPNTSPTESTYFEGKLRDVVDSIQDFQSKYLLKQRPFYHYVIQYRSDLVGCINNAVMAAGKKDKFAKRTNFSCQLTGPDSLKINAHEELLTTVFTEVISNACDQEMNDNSVLNFAVSEFEENEDVSLIISQNAPFKHDRSHKGGYFKEVIPILEIFGKPGTLLIQNEPFFRISVMFSKHILNNF